MKSTHVGFALALLAFGIFELYTSSFRSLYSFDARSALFVSSTFIDQLDVDNDDDDISESQFQTSRNPIKVLEKDFPPYCLAPLHFLDESIRREHPVALASFPGSGNTWLRFLIEQGSRIFTGSVYEDVAFNGTFQGEGSKDSNTICVKTHFPCPKCWTYQECPRCAGGKPVTSVMTKEVKKADAVIYLLRSPFDSFLAEFYRIKTGEHAGKLPPSAFTQTFKKKSYETEYDKPTWNQFTIHRLEAYMESVRTYLAEKSDAHQDEFWDITRTRRTKLVFYEKLKSNPQSELTRIFGFLQNLDEQAKKSLPLKADMYASCALLHNQRDAFVFQRNRSARAVIFNPWQPNQIQRVCEALGDEFWFKDMWGECLDGKLQIQRTSP